MNDILLNILSVAVAEVVLPLISFLGYRPTQWLNSKVKDDRAKALLNRANEIVLNASRAVCQTYVEALKKEGSFDAKAQETALGKAKAIVLSELTEELKTELRRPYGLGHQCHRGFDLQTQELSITPMKGESRVVGAFPI